MEAEPSRYEEPENLLESMLATQRTDPEFSEEDLVGNMFTILLAGEDTTADTLAWTHLAARRPARDPGPHRRGGRRGPGRGLGAAGVRGGRAPHLHRGGPARVDPAEAGRSPPAGGTARPTRRSAGCRMPAETRLLLTDPLRHRTAAGHSEELYPERWLDEKEETAAPNRSPSAPARASARAATSPSSRRKRRWRRSSATSRSSSTNPRGEVRESFKLAMVPVGLRVRLSEREPARALA